MCWYRLRNLLLGLISLACLGFAGFVAYSLLYRAETIAVPLGGPFALVDTADRPITDAAFRGRYLLLYFGYTYCPDICPTKLIDMTHAIEGFENRAPERAARLTPLFITLDPERDTGAVLHAYMQHFHPRFVALTGAEAAISAVTDAYNVYYRKVPIEGADDYVLDHVSYVYLMGPDGQYLTHFSAATDVAQMTDALLKLVR